MKKAALLLLGLPLLGCSGLRPQPAYVQADRDTFNAIAPVIRTLADTDPANDPDLTGSNGEALLLLVDTWELRIKTAEESLQ